MRVGVPVLVPLVLLLRLLLLLAPLFIGGPRPESRETPQEALGELRAETATT